MAEGNGISMDKLEKAAFILKTVAHPTRLAIIELLTYEEEITVGDFCKRLNCEQSLISHHLINLKLKGLLSARKDGQLVFYRLKERELVALIGCVENCSVNM